MNIRFFLKRALYRDICFFILLIFFSRLGFSQKGDPALTEIWNPVPPVISPGKNAGDAPSDAIILFKAVKDTANWMHVTGKPFGWQVKDDFFTVKPGAGSIETRDQFGSCQLHIEWKTPSAVSGEGQGRGNSGLFFMGRYELQILDSYQNATYVNGQAGSIYKQKPPFANACRPPGEWQSYDVIFTAPAFNPDSTLKSPAFITVFHNGVLIHNQFALWGQTRYIGIPKYQAHDEKAPLMLQDHGNEVSFRNIWIRQL